MWELLNFLTYAYLYLCLTTLLYSLSLEQYTSHSQSLSSLVCLALLIGFRASFRMRFWTLLNSLISRYNSLLLNESKLCGAMLSYWLLWSYQKTIDLHFQGNIVVVFFNKYDSQSDHSSWVVIENYWVGCILHLIQRVHNINSNFFSHFIVTNVVFNILGASRKLFKCALPRASPTAVQPRPSPAWWIGSEIETEVLEKIVSLILRRGDLLEHWIYLDLTL